MFLTKAETDTFTIEQCEKHLRKLAKTYKLDKSLQEYMTPELWDDLDNIVNTLLYLEDRIDYIKQLEHLNAIRPKKEE
jgi:hypothetical protein